MEAQSIVGRSRSAWSIAEVAERHGVSKQFIRNEITAGRLRAKRLGRRVVILLAAEKEWLEAAPER